MHDFEQLPAYASAKSIRTGMAQVHPAWLRLAAERGWIRSVKLHRTRQGGRLYNTADLANLMQRLATGYEPQLRVRRAAALMTDHKCTHPAGGRRPGTVTPRSECRVDEGAV